MSGWRSPDLASRRAPPPVPGSAAYRGLAPVRLDQLLGESPTGTC